MSRRVIAGIGIISIALAGGARAADSPIRGERIAQMWCSGCHMVRGAQDDPTSDLVPSFVTVSHQRSQDQILAKLRDPHGGMPTDAMTDRDIKDIAAYIKSLD